AKANAPGIARVVELASQPHRNGGARDQARAFPPLLAPPPDRGENAEAAGDGVAGPHAAFPPGLARDRDLALAEAAQEIRPVLPLQLQLGQVAKRPPHGPGAGERIACAEAEARAPSQRLAREVEVPGALIGSAGLLVGVIAVVAPRPLDRGAQSQPRD